MSIHYQNKIAAFRAAMTMRKKPAAAAALAAPSDYLKNIRNKMDVYDDILIFIVVVGTVMLIML